MGGGGSTPAPGTTSPGMGLLENVINVLGMGIASQGGAGGPMLLGVADILRSRRDAARQAAVMGHIRSLFAPETGTTTLPGGAYRMPEPGYFEPGAENLPNEMRVGGPVTEPSTTRSYTRLPTGAELLQRLTQQTMQEPVTTDVYNTVLGALRGFPVEPQVPSDIAEARAGQEYERALGAARPDIDPRAYSGAEARRMRVLPPKPAEPEYPSYQATPGGTLLEIPPRGGVPRAAGDVPLGPRETESRAAEISRRAKLDKYYEQVRSIVKQEETRGERAPVEVWESLLRVYDDVVPKDDFVRKQVEEAQKERARQARPSKGPTTRRTRKTQAISLTNDQVRNEINTSVAEVAQGLTRSGHLKDDPLPYVVLPNGRKVRKTVILEEAFATAHPELRVQITWNPGTKRFEVVQAQRVTEDVTETGPTPEPDPEEVARE